MQECKYVVLVSDIDGKTVIEKILLSVALSATDAMWYQA